jgi:hypothetical protein
MKDFNIFILCILSIHVNESSSDRAGRDKPCPYRLNSVGLSGGGMS